LLVVQAQSVLWHFSEGWLLSSGSFDKTVALMDCRNGSVVAKYGITADIEAMAWDPHCSYHLYCATEDGVITAFDARFNQGHAFRWQAHGGTVSSMSFCSSVPGLLATASIDKTVRIWDTYNMHNTANNVVPSSLSLESYAMTGPAQVAYKSMAVGKLFALQFHGEDPFVLATGGDKGMVAVWETDENETIKQHFSARLNAAGISNNGSSSSSSSFSIGSFTAATGTTGAKSSQASTAVKAASASANDDSWMNEPCKPKHNNQNNKKMNKGKK
jgi:periodic tryptophan protein 1